MNQDLFHAMQSVNYVVSTIQGWRDADVPNREGTDTDAAAIVIDWEDRPYGAFYVAKEICSDIGVDLVTPRCVGKQAGRNNVPSDSPSTYYKRSIWFPYLDAILQSLRDKFSSHQLTILQLVALVPSMIEGFNWADVVSCWMMYRSEVASEEEVKSEFEQWKAFCLTLSKDQRPTTTLEALDIIPIRFKNIKILLHIFTTLPVLTCTAERAFSALLKLLKNFLRNRCLLSA